MSTTTVGIVRSGCSGFAGPLETRCEPAHEPQIRFWLVLLLVFLYLPAGILLMGRFLRERV
jgi:hypothetical protein